MGTEMRIDPAIRDGSASRRVTELARRQFGPVARRQLLAMGLTGSRIGRWVELGHLHPRYPGVYAFGRADLPVEGQLAAGLLYAGKGSALGGPRSLVDGIPAQATRPHPHRCPGPALLTRSPPDPPPDATKRRSVRELPVAALPHALLVASEALSHDSLRLVLARAEFAGALDFTSLQSALSLGPRGARQVRAATDAHLPQLARCANGLERNFVLLCEKFGLEIRSRTRGSAATGQTYSGEGTA